jgi:hypothetical protein
VFNYKNNKILIPNLQQRIAQYLLEAPNGFNLIYRECLLEFTAKCHNLESVPADKETIVLKNFHNHCAIMVLRIATKENYNIDKLY